MSKFAQVAADAFEKLQINAGVILTEFDPDTGVLDKTKIFAATGDGVSFTAEPEYIDFGDGIDNVPPNTKQLMRIESVTPVMSGTLRTADTDVAKRMMAAADVVGNKIIPRMDLVDGDFFDLWWVGDYSSINVDMGANQKAGFIAVKLINALSTGGFSMQSSNRDKGEFEFEFTGHYDIADIDMVPYEVYIQPGQE